MRSEDHKPDLGSSLTDCGGKRTYRPFNTSIEESESREDERVRDIERVCNKGRIAKFYLILGVADTRSF